MRSLIAFITVIGIQIFSRIFYRLEQRWLGPVKPTDWQEIKLAVLLNHTSLYEPLFSPVLPFAFLWRFLKNMAAPAAEETLNRPIVGAFWKLMIPHARGISRKRDDTWAAFMEDIRPDSVVVIAPEGRMKRPGGLDKHGKPMTVRGGIADILSALDQGKMLICYSGGLHHVQAPGQHLPRLFKTIRMNMEIIDIATYKTAFPKEAKAFKAAVVTDFQQRLASHCPPEEPHEA